MVAKYRPAMPIMTLVVPYLKRDGLKWKLEGRHTARQALLTSGLLPMLAAPTPSGECVAAIEVEAKRVEGHQSVPRGPLGARARTLCARLPLDPNPFHSMCGFLPALHGCPCLPFSTPCLPALPACSWGEPD